MGGGGWYYVPKVWSPSGGWWNNPKNWKTNTGIAFAGLCVATAMVFDLSRSLERRPVKPMFPIPSERWCVHPPGT